MLNLATRAFLFGDLNPSRPWRRLAVEQLVAVSLVAAAALIRTLISHAFPNVFPFATFFPAILGASLFGGWRGGATAVGLSALIGWKLFLPTLGTADSVALGTWVNLGIFLVTGAILVATGEYVHGLVARLNDNIRKLQDSEGRYRTLFNSMSEGFTLCAAIRDQDGQIVDCRVLEVNPAMLQMTGQTEAVSGRRLSEFGPDVMKTWMPLLERAMSTGETVRSEFYTAASGRWRELYLNRVDGDRFCQFFVDITERKRAEAIQTQLFNELNHRIKNNLQIVSALLRMQAGSITTGPAREHLLKAVSRIQTISDIHSSLYKGDSMGDVDFAEYLGELCERLSQSLLDGSGRVRLQVDAQPIRLGLDQAVPLGMVVNELVTNAAKYAYPGSGAGIIRVGFQADQETCILSVSDDGCGLPGGFGGKTSGLGMKLVAALATQVEGVLDVGEGPGAWIAIRMPLRAASPGIQPPSLTESAA